MKTVKYVEFKYRDVRTHECESYHINPPTKSTNTFLTVKHKTINRKPDEEEWEDLLVEISRDEFGSAKISLIGMLNYTGDHGTTYFFHTPDFEFYGIANTPTEIELKQ